jgi:thiol-disulfide isomerase/thioredoxin
MNSRKYVFSWLTLGILIAVAAVACSEGDSAVFDPSGRPTQAAPAAQPTRAPETTEPTNSAVLTGTPVPKPEPTNPPPLPTYPEGVLEVYGIDAWLNSEPFTIADKLTENHVVLVDFWTYTCVNCLRTLPFLREWHAKYADRGLVILGVHTPEFDFEKDYDNVREAVEREGIGWPIALDNDYETWDSFRNRYWPAKYLIGLDGQLTYRHFGEGAYIEVEQAIRDALTSAGWDVSDIPVGSIDSAARDPQADRITRELYGGYERNYTTSGIYAGQEQYYIEPNATREYVDPGVYTPQQFFLQGLWTNGPESIIHARETNNLEDHLAFQFVGRSANVVINPTGPEPFDVYVEIDDRPLKPEEAGIDILFDDQGRSYFTVDEAKLYAFLEVPEFGEHIVKLASDSDNFAVFAFTFGINDGGI